MTGWWDDHRPFTIALLTWAVGGLLFLLIVRLPFGGAIAELRADEGSRAELQRFYQDPEAGASAARPHDEARRRLTTVRQELDAALEASRAYVEFKPGKAFRIPAEATEREIEYTKLRDAATALLLQVANQAGVAVPLDYDPRTSDQRKELPSAEETDPLLMPLAMADRAVRAAIRANVQRVLSVHHRLGTPRGAPLAEREVVIELHTGLDALVAFLEDCSTPPEAPAQGSGILAVRAVEIKTTGRPELHAKVTLAAIEAGEIKVTKPTPTREDEPKPGKVIRSF